MFTRRHVLQISAASAALSALSPHGAVAQTVPVRRSLHDMDLDDPVLVSLRDFVTAMKDPSRNGQPVSWVSFASIHGTASGFNMCPHGNWYFLPWHRAYLQMYERAVRSITGNAQFAMPFWDWTAHPDFPAAFGDQNFDGRPNPLFVPGRLMTTGSTIAPDVSGQAVLDAIMASPSFEEFGSSRANGQNSSNARWIKVRGVDALLEATPHNLIHCLIRGPFMCAGTSPQDPIFQMHHCNIDRIWDAWVRAGGVNSTNRFWLEMVFNNNFISPTGTRYSRRVRDLRDVAPLGYTYVPAAAPLLAAAQQGRSPKPPPLQPDPGRSLYLSALYGAPVNLEATGLAAPTVTAEAVRAAPDAPANVTLATAGVNLRAVGPVTAAALEASGVAPRRAKLFLRDIMPDLPEGTQLRVFVNAPGASMDTPTVGNPNFLTSIGFFGVGPGGRMRMEGMTHEKGMAGMEPSVQIDIPSGLGLEAGAETVTLQLVPVPLTPQDRAGPVAVTQVELAVV